MDARPTITAGVPPMRSRVKKAKPFNRPPSRAVLMSTHSSVCLEISPIPNGLGPSAQRSAISSISASPSIVQSLVSTSIAMVLHLP